MQPATIVPRVKVFFTKKRIIWASVILVVLLVILYFIFGRGGGATNVQTDIVKVQDIQKTVLTTGVVMSSTDLDLSFQSSGVVTKLNVKEGDAVKSGQVLATLNQGAAAAALQSAQANYDKISAAATAQDVAVSQATVDAATTALTNAKQNLTQNLTSTFNTASNAIVVHTDYLFTLPQSVLPIFSLNGTAQTNWDLTKKVNDERGQINGIFSAWQTDLSTLSDTNTDKIVSDSLTNLNSIHNFLADLFTLITTYSNTTVATDHTTIPSASSDVALAKTAIDNAITTLNANSQATRTAQSSLAQAQAALALKQAPARPEDLAAAQAQVNAALVTYNNTIIRAPMDGTITQVDTKLGEQAQMGVEAIKLQNVGDLHAEADVSEADIVAVNIGQSIDYTFDALGPDQHFSGAVLSINPASTVISGVVDYKVKGSFNDIPGIKPGMTANMTILVAQKKAALVVQASAVINQNNKTYVRVVDDLKKKTYHQVQVTTGLQADAGLTEITSGLTQGQTVVTFIQ